MLVEFEFRVYASNGKANRVFTKSFGSDKDAELFRKTEEAACGFPVTKHFTGATNQEESVPEEVDRPSTKSEEKEEPTPTNGESVPDKGEDTIDYDFTDKEDTDEYPRGWHRKKEFVSKYGTVYNKGDEVPEEFRTKVPTDY